MVIMMIIIEIVVMTRCDQQRALWAAAAVFHHFRCGRLCSQRSNMSASSDRNPPPFPAAEEPEPGLSDMADGDSDEGEDIFVSNVRF